MKIKDLSGSERPRERLLSSGPSVLSDAQLMAVILRSGMGGKNVIDMSNELLNRFGGSLATLSRAGAEELCSVGGIGPDKACSLMAAFELGRRCEQSLELLGEDGAMVVDSQAAYNILKGRVRALDHEQMWVLYIGRRMNYIGMEMLSKGGTSATVIDPRVIVSGAIRARAAAVIIAHNHPSGNPFPGQADIVQTERLSKALEPFEIRLVDHIIIGNGSYYSFSTEKVTKVLKTKEK